MVDKLKAWVLKKKFMLTMCMWAAGTGLAYTIDDTTLLDYMKFCIALGVIFMPADVFDKFMNGGSYDPK